MKQDWGGYGVGFRHVEKALARLNGELAEHGGLSEQQEAGIRMLAEGQRIQTVTGVAGAGKTTILSGARAAWDAEGYRVRGVALSGIAAANMQEAGIEAQTIHSIEGQWRVAQEIITTQTNQPLTPNQQAVVGKLLTKKDVLVIDEAGMVGSRQMQRVLSEAERAGAKVVLVGDDAQLQSIEAGAAFRHIKERVGGADLNEVRRQREEWQRDATQYFAAHRTEAGLDAYIAHDDVQLIEGDARERLVEDYTRSYIRNRHLSRVVLAYTRKDVDWLNQAIRQRMIDSRVVAGEESVVLNTTNQDGVTVPEALASGDRIMFRKNDRALGVMNGSLGTIAKVTQHGHLKVQLDSGRAVSFNASEYSQFQLGYASTVHKAQGVTVDESYILASRHFDRHTTYVAMSRHRFNAKLYGSQAQNSQNSQEQVQALKQAARYTSRAAMDNDMKQAEQERTAERVSNLYAAYQEVFREHTELVKERILRPITNRMEAAHHKMLEQERNKQQLGKARDQGLELD